MSLNNKLGRNNKKGGNPSWELYVLQVLNKIVIAVENGGGGSSNLPSTGNHTSVGSGLDSSTEILPLNNDRKGAVITNNSDKGVYLKLGSGPASSSSFTAWLPAGSPGAPISYYEVPYGYTGPLFAISDDGNDIGGGNLQINELI